MESATNAKKLKITICGIRGIPANYGGFETFAEALSARLADRGHAVTVYRRSHLYQDDAPYFNNIRLRTISAPKRKYLETPVHTFKCLVDILRRRETDVVLVCNAANSPFLWLLKFGRIPVAVNVDGIERLRAKWNRLGKLWYKLGERCSVWFADEIVSDAKVIKDYYLERYAADSEVIAYGYRECAKDEIQWKLDETSAPAGLSARLAAIGVQPEGYILYVSRLEPENNAHVVIEAHKRLGPLAAEMPLVIVGDAPYAAAYRARLHSMAQPSVKFLGFRFGAEYEDLQKGALVYIQATEVGGTHPALVESMGYANCVIANKTPENEEVLGSAGLFYQKNSPEDLAAKINKVLTDRAGLITLRRAAFERANKHYDWEGVCNQYEQLFLRLAP